MSVLRVNMADLTYKVQPLPEEWKMLGGRGLTSTIISQEVPAGCEALGEFNKLVLAPGLLCTTGAPSSGRLSAGAKSPLTGGVKEANAGGMGAIAITKLGYECIILEGVNDGLYILYITKNGIEILPCPELKEVGTFETAAKLQEKYGKQSAVICIGPAGERRYSIAGIAVADMEGRTCRMCARGGLGAVMGTKGIKAVVVDPTGGANRAKARPEEMKEIVKNWVTKLHPAFDHLRTYGSAVSVFKNNDSEVMPNHGFCGKALPEEKVNKISGQTIRDLQIERGGRNEHTCHPGCLVQCSNIYNDKDGNYITSGFEYETIALDGANCDIFDIDLIAKMDHFCDDFGVDTIDFGGAIAQAMEGGIIKFGDEKAWWNMTEEMKNDTMIGKVLGQGTGIAGKVFGSKRITAVKGQGFPGYDPRVFKGTGVTFATSPQGACHTAGCTLPGRKGYHPPVNVPMDPSIADNMVLYSRDLQSVVMLVDSFGLCSFMGSASIFGGHAIPALNAVYGTNYSFKDMVLMGEKLMRTEFQYNKACGLGVDDMMDFFRTEPTGKRHLVYDVPFEEMQNIWELQTAEIPE
ncbi:MAG: aldehyde ferredoxin oxidoreductase N-terminal domain-containing protein [Oscillospiraceae bacterium]